MSVGLLAQSGSVPYTVSSFENVPAATVEAEYPLFSSLSVMPFSTTNQAPIDYVLLQRFHSYSETDPVAAEEDDDYESPVYMVAEYHAYHKATDTYRESGLMAFSFKVDPTTAISGDNIIGFIRETAVPSSMPQESNPGYFDGLAGDFEWDYLYTTRSAYTAPTGALYDPTYAHADYVTLTSTDSGVLITGFLPHVPNSDYLNWRIGITEVRALDDRATLAPRLYYGIVSRSDGLTTEELLLDDEDASNDLVPTSLGLPWEIRNKLYVLRLNDLNDSDYDGIPDFLDLTYTLQEMPFYANSGGANNWYYTNLLKDWVYSTRSTDWDFSAKFGWIWPSKGATRANFWFYSAASSSLGWLWSRDGMFPYVYRHQDSTWLYWVSSEETATGRQTTFYNFSTEAYETISF